MESAATIMEYEELLNSYAALGTSPLVKTANGPGITYRVAEGIFQGRAIQLVMYPDGLRVIPVPSHHSASPPTAQSGGANTPPTGQFTAVVQTAGHHSLLTSPQVVPHLATQQSATMTGDTTAHT